MSSIIMIGSEQASGPLAEEIRRIIDKESLPRDITGSTGMGFRYTGPDGNNVKLKFDEQGLPKKYFKFYNKKGFSGFEAIHCLDNGDYLYHRRNAQCEASLTSLTIIPAHEFDRLQAKLMKSIAGENIPKSDGNDHIADNLKIVYFEIGAKDAKEPKFEGKGYVERDGVDLLVQLLAIAKTKSASGKGVEQIDVSTVKEMSNAVTQ